MLNLWKKEPGLFKLIEKLLKTKQLQYNLTQTLICLAEPPYYKGQFFIFCEHVIHNLAMQTG